MKSKQIYTGVSTSFAFRQQLENPLYTYCKSETSGRYAAGIYGTGSVWCGTDIPTSKKPSCPMTDTPSARELAGTWSVYELVEERSPREVLVEKLGEEVADAIVRLRNE